ncbi:MAG: ABC transporter substrate-binding protein [Candidatus Thermoplasmatota archaeon]
MKRLIPAAVAAAVCLCLVMSIVPQGPEVLPARIAQTEEAVLKIGFLEPIDSLNPMIGLNEASFVFYGLVYDALQSAGNELEAVPNLATDWWVVPETDPDMISSGEPYGSVWQYNITGNALWSDGTAFTAADVAWNINLQAEYYDSMWAFQPYAYFMDHAELYGSDSVRVHYSDRETGDPMAVSFGHFLPIYMLPMHKLSSMSPYEIGFSWDGAFEGEDPPVVGTGPFIAGPNLYDEWLSGATMNLSKNPDHHLAADQGLETSIDRIELHFYDDADAMSLDLQGGAIDVAQLPYEQYEALGALVEGGSVANVTLFDGPRCDGYWTHVGFNMYESGPNLVRLDPAVREALAMATDKAHIVEEMYGGYADEGSTLVAPVNEPWHYEPSEAEAFLFDPDAANATLEAAGYSYPYVGAPYRVATAASLAVAEGWALEGDPLVLEMLVRMEHPEEVAISIFLAESWASVGVGLGVSGVDEPTLATIVYSYTYDTCIWDWYSEPDPNYILFCQSQRSWAAWSDNMYSAPDYEMNYNLSVTEMDPETRAGYVHACQLIHYQDVPYIVMAYTHQTYAWRTDNLIGWGDWSEDPGRSLSAYWTANPLLFDLNLASENSAPENLAIDVPSGDVYEGQLVAFTVSADDAEEDALFLELDFGDGTAVGQTFLSGVSTHYEDTFMHSFDEAGVYDLTLTADDQTGLAGHVVEYGPVEFTVLEDDIAPVTEIELVGDGDIGSWFVSAIQVHLNATDVGGEVEVTEWALDNEEWAEYVGPFFVSAEGEHQILYRSNDTNGNTEAAKSVVVRIDTVAPTVVIEMDLTQTSSTVTLEAQWEDASSGVMRTTYSLDGGAPQEPVLNSTITLTEVADGEHTVVVTVYDDAGHSASATATFEVETSIFALDGPAGPWVVIGMAAALLAIMGVAGFMLYRRKSPPTE